MTVNELAEKLNGNEYDNEIPKELEQEAKENNLVVVFGASDDLMEFRGAIYDEIDANENVEAFITSKGLLRNECDNDECPYFEFEKTMTKIIEAIWDTDGYSWIYETDIPHSTFDILEDGEKYCRGIVFNLNDV